MEQFDLLRDEVSRRVGENVLYLGEVLNITHNLGRDYARGTMAGLLRDYALNTRNIGIDTRTYGFGDLVHFYPQAGAWEFLKRLDEEGKISIEGVESFDDLVARNYLRKRPARRRLQRALIPGDPDPSFENVVRAQEES